MQRRDPMELNFEGLKMQKINIPTNRAQKVDGKNTVICLAVIFTPKVMVINSSFFAFFADDSKKLVHLRDLIEFFE